MSAPCVTSALMAAPWFSAAAHISAVCPCQVSAALTLAPRSISAVTTSALPARAAVMRMVSPSGPTALAFAPALSSARAMTALPLVAASDSGRDAVAVGGADVRAGADQQLRRLGVVRPDGPVERRHAVRFGGVDRGFAEERADAGAIARLHGVDQSGAGAGGAQADGRGEQHRRAGARATASAEALCRSCSPRLLALQMARSRPSRC